MSTWDGIINELKSKQKNTDNKPQKPFIMNVYFLGSCHYAYKHPNAGQSYLNNKHVYKNESVDGSEVYFTFSGPTALDIKKPTIKSMTQLGIETLKSFIEKKLEYDDTLKIIINIKGHSRGAIIAKNVYEKLKKDYNSSKNVELKILSLLDPYAGPLNGYKKSYDDININNADIAVVYSLTEGLYASPSKVENAKIVIFTDCEHDKTKYIGRAIPDLEIGKVYWFKGYQDELRNNTVKLKNINISEKEIKYIYQKIDNYVKNNIEIIDSKNCMEVLKRFSDIKSYRRRDIFLKKIYNIKGCDKIVEEYLLNTNQKRLLKNLKANKI